MYDHNINAYIPYLFICICIYLYTLLRILVFFRLKNIRTTNNLLTKLTNKCFMNSNTYDHNNIYSKKTYLLIFNLFQTVWLDHLAVSIDIKHLADYF